METEIFNSINYIKNISKKRVTFERITSHVKKKNVWIDEEDIQTIFNNLVKALNYFFRGNDSNKSYLVHCQSKVISLY